jgi:predicted transcriptional regulator
MSVIKDEIVRLVQSLPDDCTIEEIQYHLYVREKVERGLAAIDAGQTVAQDEAERRVDGWLKSAGPSPR